MRPAFAAAQKALRVRRREKCAGRTAPFRQLCEGQASALQGGSDGNGKDTTTVIVHDEPLGRQALVSPLQAPFLHLENLKPIPVHHHRGGVFIQKIE